MAAMTLFRREKCCHLESKCKVSAGSDAAVPVSF